MRHEELVFIQKALGSYGGTISSFGIVDGIEPVSPTAVKILIRSELRDEVAPVLLRLARGANNTWPACDT